MYRQAIFLGPGFLSVGITNEETFEQAASPGLRHFGVPVLHFLLPRSGLLRKTLPLRWEGLLMAPFFLIYARTTFAAWKPLGPFSRSNSTVSPSLSVR